MADLTKNEMLVLKVLQGCGKQLSAYDILDKLRPKGLKAPLQIYRALDKLIELKLVHKLESLNAFVSCAHHSCHESDMTAFTICQDCGKVNEFSSGAIADLLGAQTKTEGFKVFQTAIEIKGTCARCM